MTNNQATSSFILPPRYSGRATQHSPQYVVVGESATSRADFDPQFGLCHQHICPQPWAKHPTYFSKRPLPPTSMKRNAHHLRSCYEKKPRRPHDRQQPKLPNVHLLVPDIVTTLKRRLSGCKHITHRSRAPEKP